jgi:hypothetical protein
MVTSEERRKSQEVIKLEMEVELLKDNVRLLQEQLQNSYITIKEMIDENYKRNWG